MVSFNVKKLTTMRHFSPIAKLKSIRIQFAIGAYKDYEIRQIDVKTAFLDGKLEEEM